MGVNQDKYKGENVISMASCTTNSIGPLSKIIHENPRPGDIKHSLASIEETKQDLGYEPKYDLIEGLKETIQYFMKLFSLKN